MPRGLGIVGILVGLTIVGMDSVVEYNKAVYKDSLQYVKQWKCRIELHIVLCRVGQSIVGTYNRDNIGANTVGMYRKATYSWDTAGV